MNEAVKKERTKSLNPVKEPHKNIKKPHRILMQVKNKKGSLAKVSMMLSDRGARIESLDFKPSSKAGLAELSMNIFIDQGQLQGVLNDAQRMAEIKSACVEALSQGQ